MNTLSTELLTTTLTAAFTGLLWMPIIVNRLREMGPWKALKNPQPDVRPATDWAYRLANAHRNAIENLVVFASLAIIVHVLQASNGMTALAGWLFLGSRIAHAVIYTLGIPLWRTIAFVIGFGCQMGYALRILSFAQ
jgi:uncharacterized MAPEG superfamily protein